MKTIGSIVSKAVAVCLIASLCGCYSYRVRSGSAPATPPTQETGMTFVYGLVGTNAVAPECPGGLSYVETWEPWWAVLVSGITIGLVTPWKAQWACSAPGAHASATPAAPTAPSPQ